MSETGKTTGAADKNASTVAADKVAVPPPSGARSAARETVVVRRPTSRAAKAFAVVIVAALIGCLAAAVYHAAQRLSKNGGDIAAAVDQTMDPTVQYLKTALGAATTATPAAKAGQMVSSMTAADLASPCRLLLKGIATDFRKADLSCLKSPDTFKGIAVTADQAARFCHGIAKVNPAVGMQCVSGMYRKVFDKTTSQRRLQ